MSLWKTLKELIFGAPLKEQFEQLLEKEEAKVAPEPAPKKARAASPKKKKKA